MKILVTGVSGFIGGHIASYLLSKGHKVVGISRREPPKPYGFKFVKLDLSVPEVDLEDGIDIVVHAAAQSPYNTNGISSYIRSNIVAFENLISFAKRVNVKKIVYLSSISVYGKINTTEVKEGYKPVAPGIYGMTKYMGELMLKESGIPSFAVRLPGVIGKGAHSCWLAKIAALMAKGEKVKVCNSNFLFNNVICVPDLAMLIEYLIDNEFDDKFIAFNAAASDYMKVKDMIFFMKNYLKSSSEIVFLDEKNKQPFAIDITKMVNLIGYETYTVKASLESYLGEL